MSYRHKGSETFKKVTVYRPGGVFMALMAAFYALVVIVIALKAF